MTNILVLKLTNNWLAKLANRGLKVEDLAPIELQERAAGYWKINPKRLDNVNSVLILHDKTVIAQFGLGEKVLYDLTTHRVKLSFVDYRGNNPLVGSKINYETNNPATIQSENQVKDMIIEIKHGNSQFNSWKQGLNEIQQTVNSWVHSKYNPEGILLSASAQFTSNKELIVEMMPYSNYFGIQGSESIKRYIVAFYQKLLQVYQHDFNVYYDVQKAQYILIKDTWDSKTSVTSFDTSRQVIKYLQEEAENLQLKLNNQLESAPKNVDYGYGTIDF